MKLIRLHSSLVVNADDLLKYTHVEEEISTDPGTFLASKSTDRKTVLVLRIFFKSGSTETLHDAEAKQALEALERLIST